MIFLLSTFNTILLVVGFLFTVGAGLYFLPKWFGESKSAQRKKDSKSEFIKTVTEGVPRKFAFSYVSPLLLNIGSTVEIPESVRGEVFRALEIGIINRIRTTRAKFPHWTQKMDELNLSHTFIGLIEPQATNMNGSPAILVSGIQTAGTVIGISQNGFGRDYPVQMIVLPHQLNQRWEHLSYLSHSARNESEHDAEFANEIGEALKYVGDGDVHPHHRFVNPDDELIVPEGGRQGFIGQAKPKCYFPAEAANSLVKQ